MLVITERKTQNELFTLLKENNVLSTIQESLDSANKSKYIEREPKTRNLLIKIADQNLEFLI